jgi:DNA-binding LacI/PurR family transcriptional regulator
MGRALTELLIARIGGDGQPRRRERLQGRLVVRASTGRVLGRELLVAAR